MPLQEVLRRARELTREIDDEAKRSTLPQKPDFEVADAFLTDCRREAARRSLAVGVAPSATREHEGYRPAILPVPLPPDVRTDALERFVARYVSPDSSERSPLLWLALSGAHACGFPSSDSDLDLKGVPNGVRAHDPRSERAAKL